MGLVAMLLAGCAPARPAPSAPAPGLDTVAVYAQVVAAIRTELPPGAPGVYLSDERFDGAHGKHSAGLLRELASRGVVDGVFAHERRTGTFPCTDCTRIMLGPVVEYERVLYADPDDLSEEVEPSRGIPVKHWVNVQVARTCSPEALRSGSCTEGSVGASCRGGEFHSRRYYFTREAGGRLRLVGCTVTGVV
ncbi:MAG: hypothetical protein ABW277_05415 [Longimicrobiaceae bacterium]